MQYDLRKDKLGYWSGNLIVTPLVNEDTIASAYLRFKQGGVLSAMFHEFEPSMKWFLNAMTKENTDVLACGCLDSDSNFQLCGLGWINNYINLPGLKRCDAGYGFFRDNWVPKRTEVWTKLMLEWLFNERGVDFVFGVTPVPNRLAVSFARKIGFDMYGPIDGYSSFNGEPCAVYIDSMSRTKWRSMANFKEAVEETVEV